MDLTMRKCLGGYKKNDVTAYIDEMVSKYEEKFASSEEEISSLKKQLETLLAENNKLFEKVQALEEERELVSKAVISAEQKAKLIILEAQKKADEIQAAKDKEIADAEEELERIKVQIRTMKLNAVAAVRKFEGDIKDEV